MKYYEDEFDEVLLRHNPNGGRPQKIGGLVFSGETNTLDVQNVREDTLQRFFMGYCLCGRKVVIGQKRAEYLAAVMKRKGIEPRRLVPPFKVKIAKMLLAGVDNL